jgi:predicted DNA-binding antitoxin AbrB/MazE fold protein
VFAVYVVVALCGTIEAMRFIEARYEEGLLKPERPLALTPGERVALVVVRQPDPKRWNLDRLAKSGEREDPALAEQGLAEWADALDREDESGGP